MKLGYVGFLSLIFIFSTSLSIPVQAKEQRKFAAFIPGSLTEAGEEESAEIFQHYVTRHTEGCRTRSNAKRVLLTGFGPFESISLNSAGSIVTNIADPSVWPTKIDLNEAVKLGALITVHNGKTTNSENRGARLYNRTLYIGRTEINLCVLVMDVLWNVAGSIVAYEMNRFQPQAVLMLGGGGGPILEAGALNYATYATGYYWDGTESKINLPIGHRILDLEDELKMTWNNVQIRQVIDPLLQTLGLELTAAPQARKRNNYLCNQTSFIALAAANNVPINLSGGKIKFNPQIRSKPVIGFFHLPWNLAIDRTTVENWGSVVMAVLYQMIAGK